MRVASQRAAGIVGEKRFEKLFRLGRAVLTRGFGAGLQGRALVARDRRG